MPLAARLKEPKSKKTKTEKRKPAASKKQQQEDDASSSEANLGEEMNDEIVNGENKENQIDSLNNKEKMQGMFFHI